MPEFLLETIIDTLKAVPILFFTYLLIEILETKFNFEKMLGGKSKWFGPGLGAIVGCIPQCGFSAASTTLYNSGIIGAATLISVYLATSDEAIPVLLSHSAQAPIVLLLIVVKLLIAALTGYLLMVTVYRKEKLGKVKEYESAACDKHCHHRTKRSILLQVCIHTLKTISFIAVTLLIINLAVSFIGEERLSSLLLSQSAFQPFLTALLGLIPGCATSVLIVELFVSGTISFGSAIAGLCTGAGFGFLILFKGNTSYKHCFQIVGLTYLSAVIFGLAIHLLF